MRNMHRAKQTLLINRKSNAGPAVSEAGAESYRISCVGWLRNRLTGGINRVGSPETNPVSLIIYSIIKVIFQISGTGLIAQ